MGKSRSSARHAWEAAFLKALREYGKVNAAAHAAGITTGPPYNRRKVSASFDAEWKQALAAYNSGKSKRIRNSEERPAPRQWKRVFLDALAETSNVAGSARQAGIAPRVAYRTRRSCEDFASDWRAALFEGYANLEMEVLGYLRDPAPAHKMDVTAALRLLAAHKETIAQERATRANVSAAEVRASIERKVDELRKKVAGRDIQPERPHP
ncbi:hypothetical protein [Qipengyuania aquimaris]|uniref:hypothetical protein n=1 Tax=Qipengyuania aquimaris TaxID=255984 RepID=UPI001CD2C9F8|nr:hypothetical protein [Qipengyuania aquimaris]MCA0903621.1 hypothetical protein [Qipengyuania aquimaris]